MSYHVLFICTHNWCRSPTGEQVFADWPGVETRSAGTGEDARTPVSAELLAWSDLVFVMEDAHCQHLSQAFGAYLAGTRVVCLDIPDVYQYMDPVLVQLLRDKVGHFLPTP